MTDREIYEKHADELIRFATALVGPGDAPDMLSTAVVNALGSKQWPHVTNHRAYLYRSVLNATRSWQRSSGRRRTREYAVAETAVLPPPELHVDVRDAVADLSPQQRAVVHLTYWADQTNAQVADLLGISEGSVKTHLHRAKKTLKRKLDD